MRTLMTSLLTIAGLASCASLLIGCSGEVAVGSNEKQLQIKPDGKPTGNGETCTWEGTRLLPAEDCSPVPTPSGYGPYAVGDEFASPDGCNECACTAKGIMCTVLECEGTNLATDSVACTLEAKICADGTAVGRQGPDCKFAPCPGEESEDGDACAVACTEDAKICADGSSVGRSGPKCEFEACPDEENVVCTDDVKICAEGIAVGRQGPDCEFAPCPDDGNVVCTDDAQECPDGSFVGRTAPDCEFAPCPDDIACPADAVECPDGSFVGRTAPNCEFAPCPGEEVACDLDAKVCADGSTVGREGPECEFVACPYEPCEGKACGEPCTVCAPDDLDCSETAVEKACDDNGVCGSGQVSCQ